MRLFPMQIFEIAKRNKTLGSLTGAKPVRIELVNELDIRKSLNAIPNRVTYFSVLTFLATSGERLRPAEYDEFIEKVFTSQSEPSSEDEAFVTELLNLHGHSTTVTIAAIQQASRSPYFSKSTFNSSREEDPEFWALLWNFGRPRMPASVFAPYALYEAERRLGKPIRDLSKINALLFPAATGSDASL